MNTYTLTCNAHTNHAKERAEAITGTLDSIRETLLSEATRWGWNLEGSQDLADEVFDGTAPEATEREVIALASQVWDESEKHISVTAR